MILVDDARTIICAKVELRGGTACSRLRFSYSFLSFLDVLFLLGTFNLSSALRLHLLLF